MLTMTIGLLAWIGGGTLAALAVGRASAIGSDPIQRRTSPPERS